MILNQIFLQTDTQLVEEILLRHKGSNFVQCMKCGSLKSESRELLKTVLDIDSENLYRDSFYELSQGMIDYAGDNCDERNLDEWCDANEERFLPELTERFDDFVFIKSQDVILIVDKGCGCFQDLQPTVKNV